jgi:hypothetical protein
MRPNESPSTRAELVVWFGEALKYFKKSMDSDESWTMVGEFAVGVEIKGAAMHAMSEGDYYSKDVMRAYHEAQRAETDARLRLVSLIDKSL